MVYPVLKTHGNDTAQNICESQHPVYRQHEADGSMPKHGSSLQLDGSRLLTPGGYEHLDYFLRTSFADLLETAHLPANDSRPNLGMYLEHMQILRDMLKELCYYFEEDEDYQEDDYQEDYQEDSREDDYQEDDQEDEDYQEDEDMFEYYKAGEHCSTHSSPEAEDALMERSNGYIFFFGGIYSLGWGGRRWAYRCELEDTLQRYEDRMRDYRMYVDGLATATI